MKTKQMVFPLQVKALDEKEGAFEGYGAVFGNKDSYGDIIVKGAFSNHLSSNSARSVKLLWQHDSSMPIGVYDEVREDSNGLYVKGRLLVNDVEKAREAYALLKEGAISGLSIGFSINQDGAEMKDGALYLKDLKLWEISIVTFPANPLANVDSIKSASEIKDIRDYEKFLRDAGFSKHEAMRLSLHGYKAIGDQCDADTEKAQLLGAIKQLNELIKKR